MPSGKCKFCGSDLSVFKEYQVFVGTCPSCARIKRIENNKL